MFCALYCLFYERKALLVPISKEDVHISSHKGNSAKIDANYGLVQFHKLIHLSKPKESDTRDRPRFKSIFEQRLRWGARTNFSTLSRGFHTLLQMPWPDTTPIIDKLLDAVNTLGIVPKYSEPGHIPF